MEPQDGSEQGGMWPDAAAHRVPLALRGGTGSKKRLLRFPKWEIRMDRTGRDSKGRIWGYFFFLRFIYFWLHWVFVAAYRLSLVAESAGSRRAGSLVAVLGLHSSGSVVVEYRLSCSVACGIFPDQGSNSCPLHWQVDS